MFLLMSCKSFMNLISKYNSVAVKITFEWIWKSLILSENILGFYHVKNQTDRYKVHKIIKKTHLFTLKFNIIGRKMHDEIMLR